MNNVLEIQNVSKYYDDFHLNDVSFSLPEGYIMGLIGPNGAGKTTTLKLCSGILYPNSGRALLNGKRSGDAVNRKKTGFGFSVICSLSVEMVPGSKASS